MRAYVQAIGELRLAPQAGSPPTCCHRSQKRSASLEVATVLQVSARLCVHSHMGQREQQTRAGSSWSASLLARHLYKVYLLMSMSRYHASSNSQKVTDAMGAEQRCWHGSPITGPKPAIVRLPRQALRLSDCNIRRRAPGCTFDGEQRQAPLFLHPGGKRRL